MPHDPPDEAGEHRSGVGILVIDDRGRVRAFERADRPGAWQAPQGGIDPGEDPAAAAARELWEETGLRWADAEVVAEYPGWLTYDLPPAVQRSRGFRGQRQRWFLVRVDPSARVTLAHGGAPPGSGPEFRADRWTTMADLVETTWEVRRPVYQRLADAWAEHLA